jgi:ubiquinone/menaquinone biosynthesis C-methylase UbiE
MDATTPGLSRRSTMILREDYRSIASIYDDARTADRLIAHYRLERRLADEMRQSTQEQREQGLYATLYDTLLNELADHPRKAAETEAARLRKRAYVERQARMILKETSKDDVFVDIGGGDCEVALLVAPHVARAMVVDVCDKLVPKVEAENFTFVKTTGVRVPLESESVSFLYSNQLMEHLHPQDALEQLRELHRVLKPGGRYLCRTPNRVTGPHDVSRYFDDIAHGTHMQEYTYGQLARKFRAAGFDRIRILVAPRSHRLFSMPLMLALFLEQAFARVPRRFHTRICRSRVVRSLMGITLIAEKR